MGENNEKSGRGKSSGARVLRWITGIAGVLVVLLFALGIALNLLVDAEFVEKQLRSVLEEASDGLYVAEVDSIHLNMLRGTFTVLGVTLEKDPDVRRELREENELPGIRYEVYVPEIRISRINPLTLLWHGDFRAQRLHVRQPHLTFFGLEGEEVAEGATDPAAERGIRPDEEADAFHRRLERQIPIAVSFREVLIESVVIAFHDPEALPIRVDTLSGLTVQLINMEVDSVAAHDRNRIFFSEDARVTLEGTEGITEDGLYRYQVGRMDGSSLDSIVTLSSIALEPLVTDEEFVQRLEYRENRYAIEVDSLIIRGIDMRRLAEVSEFRAHGIELIGVEADIFTDMRLPRDPELPPPMMPQEMFQQVPVHVYVDSLLFRRTSIRYSMRSESGPRPGHITISDVYASAYNLTNHPDRMTRAMPLVVDVHATIEGQGAMAFHTRLPLLAPTFDMEMSGTLEDTDMLAFNEMTANTLGVRLTDGHIDSLSFNTSVTAARASGNLRMVYRDLGMEMEEWVDPTPGIVSAIAEFIAEELVLYENNVPENGELPRVGEIDHERETLEPFFGFIASSILSGVFTSIGLGPVMDLAEEVPVP